MRSQTSSISFILCFACKIYKILLSGFVGLGEKYPAERKTLGDHIRAARLERDLLQREVAESIGVRRGTINKWECNRGEPRAADFPGILDFLGYDPFPSPRCLMKEMRSWRLHNGLSARAAARSLEVGEATWAAWERGALRPSACSREKITDTLNA
jgi:transcriptional regulator with XRE-family HTH domain